MIFRWWDTLGGRLTFFVILALVPAQVIDVLTFVRGTPEDKMEQAFLPFVRLEESRSRATGGSGLGLAITRSIVLNHGGDIALMNRPEGGLRAAITLPKSQAAER